MQTHAGSRSGDPGQQPRRRQGRSPLCGLLAALALLATGSALGQERAVLESARDIPVVYRVDVVVVGGNTWAVAAALGAAQRGASVFLAAPRPYLGEDLCATLRLARGAGSTADDPLAKSLLSSQRAATPLAVKKALDDALVEAKVAFLFGCFTSDVLRDAEGQPCGIVIANRAGRQAVVAKVIVDATDRAAVARLAGAACRPWPAGDCPFQRVTIAGPSGEPRSVVHDLRLPMPDASFASFAAAEQRARDQTYSDADLRGAESLFCVPPDAIIGQKDEAAWQEQRPDLGHFRPRGVERLYVVSGCADLPRSVAARLLEPLGLLRLGRRIGSAAGRDALALPAPRRPHLPASTAAALAAGDTREALQGLRAVGEVRDRVHADARALPVWGRYDVLVIGGGTSGAPAAIAAARQGARTLVVEYQEGLGGIGTLGLIGKPYHGQNIGFTREVPFPGATGNIEHKMQWYRDEIRKAGGEIWLGALGCGAVVADTRVQGAIVATPHGRCAVLAKVVIDATGNADLAAAAGAATVYGGQECGDIALQGTGLPLRPLGKSYMNSDYLLVEDADMLDVWRALVGTRQAMNAAQYDAGPLIQNRERRRIVGDHVLAYLDQVIGRTYPDSVVFSASDYDSHGYPSAAFFALLPHDAKSLKANHPGIGGTCYTPYRCLLPKGLDGILVVGTGISMQRDASAMVRMQRDLQNQGYAAGVAAALAAKAGCGTRQVDLKALQQHLVAVGNLPAEALAHQDNFPFPAAQVAAAVETLTDPDRLRAAKALAVVLAHAQTALPRLKERYAASSGAQQLVYAKVLGFLGQAEVVPTLCAALEAVDQWDPKILQGVAAEYAHLPTPVDALVLALGYTRDRRALPPILAKLAWLDAETTLSHHRAVALALEHLADPAAAEPLARLLAKPGMRGHAMRQLEPLSSERDRRRREGPLREIVLARALYHCGDRDGLGEKILREYQEDLRGLLARHATAVLQSGKQP